MIKYFSRTFLYIKKYLLIKFTIFKPIFPFIKELREEVDSRVLQRAVDAVESSLEEFLPALMAQAKLLWDKSHWAQIERLFQRQKKKKIDGESNSQSSEKKKEKRGICNNSSTGAF